MILRRLSSLHSESPSISQWTPSRVLPILLSVVDKTTLATDCHIRAILPRASRRRSSSSTKRWQSRQGKDKFAKEARVQGLKSRAAFKLLEVTSIQSTSMAPTDPLQINEKYKIFKKGQTVVDLVRLGLRGEKGRVVAKPLNFLGLCAWIMVTSIVHLLALY